MKFTVTFRTNTCFVGQARDLGLADLDRIRRELGVPNLPAEVVQPRLASYSIFSGISIELTEEEARKAYHLFAHRNRASVLVSADKLAEYLDVVAWADRDDTTGAVECAGMEYRPDQKAIVDDWLGDGAPPEWGVEKEHEEK